MNNSNRPRTAIHAIPSTEGCMALGTGLKRFAGTVRVGDILLVLGSITALVDVPGAGLSFSRTASTAIRFIIAICCVISFFFGCKFTRNHGRYSDANKAVFAFTLLIVIQGAFSQTSPGAAVLNGLLILLACLVPLRLSERYNAKVILSMYYWPLLIMVAVIDAYCIVTGGQGVLMREDSWVATSYFLVGNKFTLSYLNMLVYGIFIYRHCTSVPALIGCFFGVYICSLARCTTGYVSFLIMGLTVLFMRLLKPVLVHRRTIPILVVAFAVVACSATWVLSMPVVQMITVDVLGKSSDLTGRLNIYSHLLKWFSLHPIFGFGSQGALGRFVEAESGYADCQEGFFQIILTNGIIGGILFLLIISIFQKRVSFVDRHSIGLYAFLLAMAIASLVEINLGAIFFLGLSLLYVATLPEEMFVADTDDK